jgi:hypothetical protein
MSQIVTEAGQPAASIDRLAYTPLAAAIATGRSRSRLYKALKAGELVARKDGRATLIEAGELRRWIGSLPVMGSQAA